MAPVLATANEECLHRDLPVLVRQREDVGIAHARGVHRLRPLDEGGGAQAIAQDGGRFEIEILRCFRHLLLYLRLHCTRFAAEEVLRFLQQFRNPPRRCGPRRGRCTA